MEPRLKLNKNVLAAKTLKHFYFISDDFDVKIKHKTLRHFKILVDIQSPAAEIRRGKKIETTGQKCRHLLRRAAIIRNVDSRYFSTSVLRSFYSAVNGLVGKCLT